MEALMQIHVENMTCGGCVRGVTNAIRSIDPAADVKAALETRDVEIKTVALRAQVLAALAAAGFDAA